MRSESFASGFRRIDSIHLLDFYLGFDAEGRHALLLTCKEQPKSKFYLRSVKIFSTARDDGKWSWFFVLEDVDLIELFSLFCGDLIESSRSISDSAKAFKFVQGRLASWRLLFERQDLGLLSESEVRGLCGELIFLKRLIEKYGEREAVASWVGPLRADQDFRMVDSAWEIKTLRPGMTTVTIASENQLDTCDRKISLVVFELAACSSATADALTLNVLVEEIQTLLSEDFDVRVEFDRLLFRSGYTRRSEYDEYNVVVRNFAVYDVDPQFPCVTPSSLASAISSVSYTLDLLQCEKFKAI